MSATPGSALALSRSSLLADIAAADLRALIAGAERRTYAAGAALFERGDAADGLYAIVSGDVRVVIAGPEGNEVTLAVLGPGEVLGELSMLDGAPRSASAIAAEPTQALFVGAARVQAWLLEHPAVAVRMLRELAQRLRATDEHVAEIVLLDVGTRLARRLWQRFCEQAGDGRARAGASLRLNQGELASVLGATRESVNRQLARLKAAGVVEVDGAKIILRDPRALEAAAGEI